jgi:hypothetical protein
MAKKRINIGDKANDRTGDSLRSAFSKINENFDELYAGLGLGGSSTIGAFSFNGNVMSTVDSTSVVIDRATNINGNLAVSGDVIPQNANVGDLGSLSHPWHTLYVTVIDGGNAGT